MCCCFTSQYRIPQPGDDIFYLCQRAARLAIGNFTYPDRYSLELVYGAEAVLIGYIVADENRPSASEWSGVKQSFYCHTLVVRSRSDLKYHLAGNQAIFIAKLLDNAVGEIPARRLQFWRTTIV